jgi:hypothetical protein
MQHNACCGMTAPVSQIKEHLMKSAISASLRTARPMPGGRDVRVTRGRAPPDSQREPAVLQRIDA